MPQEKLLDDFHSVISETEELMKSVSNESGGKTQALRTKIEDNLKQAREYLHDFEGTVVDKSRIAARKTDAYVHENAWSTVGIAVGIGILIGLLMRGTGLMQSVRAGAFLRRKGHCLLDGLAGLRAGNKKDKAK